MAVEGGLPTVTLAASVAGFALQGAVRPVIGFDGDGRVHASRLLCHLKFFARTSPSYLAAGELQRSHGRPLLGAAY